MPKKSSRSFLFLSSLKLSTGNMLCAFFHLDKLPYVVKMIRYFLFATLILIPALAQTTPGNPQASSVSWKTLDGSAPLVIARGGFSGIFPDSSEFAVDIATTSTVTNVALFCDLQITKDGYGICQPDLRLDNTTNIALVYPDEDATHSVNGKDVRGWFAVDFTSNELFNNVTLAQNVLSRPSLFDGAMPIQSLDDIMGRKSVTILWLNVEHDLFYSQQKHSPVALLQKIMMYSTIDFISSPEIGFLKAMQGKVNKAKTTFILRVLGADEVEPTTNLTYGSILKDLASIKAYATGILVPKEYILPVNADRYLLPATTLVADAHKAGLLVYASGFANDIPASYNYSYDPTTEYAQFITNGNFAVDGFLTDFPPTAAEAISCFSGNSNSSKTTQGQALIISHNGASGIYPGSTDLAYEQAISDGADIIDCSVQMSQDGIVFCLDSADLSGVTTAMPTFMSRSATIPEIQKNNGIFSFDLTWSEIQSLKPQLTSPFGTEGGLPRNPISKNAGKFVTLADFLELAKTKAVSGVLINIQNAAYLASKKGLGVVDAISKALNHAAFDQQSTQQVLIQSDDTSVLSAFNNVPTYKRVLTINEEISDAPQQSIEEVKKYADAVVVNRPSLFPVSNGFLMSNTSVVNEMHAGNVSVYVSVLRNEYIALAFDYFADPMVELATYIAGYSVDGVITDYPGTASKYLRSSCFDLNNDLAILPAQPGSLVSIIEGAEPPATAPSQALEVADIIDPPLPPVADRAALTPPAPGPDAASESSRITNVASVTFSLASILLISVISLMH